ncbi:hybrid sensor histidine kinase/response regulator [Stutzerimonas azotifigens]|uniref:hybrid sensor histidine kinase/response regulator n=1 Tax=Stutzerimonas azotifigens TaxID=291995 RepID=UPI000408FA7F|nr:PAS domain S-box protein [Stutzerimonas azotifigens]
MMAQDRHENAPVNVLVVDDRAENRLALRAILDSPDYRILEASCEQEALRHLLHTECAVILLDVIMPRVDGFELATLIKEYERTASVPIIFLTAEAMDPAFIEKAYDVGAADYLIKPLMPKMVRAKVAVFTELYRQRQRIRQQSELLVEAERRQSEARYGELQLASERRYRNLAESVPHMVWTASNDGRTEYFNRGWFEYTGAPADRVADTWLDALHPEDWGTCGADWDFSLKTGRPLEVLCRLRRHDGSYRWHLGRALPERDASGELLSWLGTFTDVDEQTRLQSTLAEFKDVLDTTLDAVLIFSADSGTVEYANDGAGLLLGYSPDELLGHPVAQLIPRFRDEDLRAMLAPQAARKAAVEASCLRQNGESVQVELSLQLVEGHRPRIIATARDITDRKQAEAMQQFLYQKALSDVEARDEFLSIAAHELRTPLTSLSLQAELLERQLAKEGGAEGGRKGELTGMLRRQISRLVRLLDELLDVSRISGGQFRISPEPLNLSEIAGELVQRHARDAEKAGTPISLHVAGDVCGHWDALRVEQVFTNLLSNAIKFGAGKPIEVSVWEEDGMAHLLVRDHGVGVPAEARERIFQRFERARSASAYAGLGLGLYITRQIVELHGGAIELLADVPQGAAFSVSLPLTPPASRTPENQVCEALPDPA